jgi:hypothetical protein
LNFYLISFLKLIEEAKKEEKKKEPEPEEDEDMGFGKLLSFLFIYN